MKDILMIGNTHFDTVWLWKWDEGMTSIHSTFRSALDRMKEDKDFIYSFATPIVFDWIKKIDPEMFEEIKARVEEGRWELCEGWWCQPDCFSACGESYARQSLYGQNYLMDNFGKYAQSLFNIDSFGHNSQTPQIMRKSHIDYYCMCRPEKWFFDIDSPCFWWQGKDGSRVKGFRIGQNCEIYNKDMEKNVNLAESNMKNADCDEMMVYGVTNHGGAPTKKAINDIHRLNSEKSYNLEFSTVAGYFEKQSDPSVVIDTEMITKNFGPYVDDRKSKTLNRLAEYAVLNAEKAAILAQKLLNAPRKQEELDSCWKDILFNSFHDILGGASFKPAYFDAYNLYGRAISTANEIMQYSLQAITKKIKTPGKNGENPWNLAIWNLNETPYLGYLEGEFNWLQEFPAYSGGIVLEDEEGNRYECQIILEGSVIPEFRSRVLFKAEIPAMGYKLFKAIQTGEGSKEREHRLQLETDEFSVKFDEKSGLIKSIYSKRLDKTFTDILIPKCFNDEADTECFNVNAYGNELEDFEFIDMETVEHGDFRTTLKVNYKFRKSLLTLYYSFYKDTEFFDVKYNVSWNESHIALKLVCDTGFKNVVAASPFASEARKDNDSSDMPMGEWIDMYDGNEGIAFIGDSTFAYTKYGSKLGLSILRSCVYADMRLYGEVLKHEDYPIMEQGIAEGRIRILMHKGSFAENKICHKAREFNNMPIVICEANHDGIFNSQDSFISLDAESAYIGCVKKSLKNDDDIVRIAEYAGNEQKVTLRFFDKEYDIEMMPYEIKTLKIGNGNIDEINITED